MTRRRRQLATALVIRRCRQPAAALAARLAALLAIALLLALAVAPVAGAAPSSPPSLRAEAAILVEPATGDIVLQRNAQRSRPIASATKLMTALLTLERARLSEVKTAVRYRALPVESVIGLRAGERLTVADLLRGLLLASANDAAATLAQRIGGSRRAFVRLMNERADELGLRQTHYTNPIGLDETGNHSSAEDLVKLTLILRRFSFFRRVTDRAEATLRTGARRRTFPNRNRLVRAVPEVNGVKTGHTLDAGYVLVGSATKAGVTVLSAVLGEPSETARDADSLALLRYGLKRYAVAEAVRRGRVYARVSLSHRDEKAELIAASAVRRTVRRGERFVLRTSGVPAQLDGPVAAGTRLGTLEVRWRGRTIARVALVTRSSVAGATFLQRVDDVFDDTVVVVVLGVAALASLQLVLLRRRAVRRRRRHADRTGIA